MHPFNYSRPANTDGALAMIDERAAFIAGGTNLLDLMKEGIATPQLVVDLRGLDDLRGIQQFDRMVRIGALESMSDVAAHPVIQLECPMVAQALLASASPQLRNMATIGGNLMQRTRCGYFRDRVFPCNKRNPGAGCPAIAGENRTHAILGASEHCIATHASDLAVALVALDASLVIRSKTDKRTVPLERFYRTPTESAQAETHLKRGELIVSVEIPTAAVARRSHYLKVRDRASYEFALVSAAVGIEWSGEVMREVRIAFGGVATKPWRSHEAEQVLRGHVWSQAAIARAGEAAARDAHTTSQNAFKVDLMRRVLERAVATLREKRT
ncbi:MAG: xanthine dehydrogenase family protein subunit M [Candidatus Baltobacteraceae bacterium]